MTGLGHLFASLLAALASLFPVAAVSYHAVFPTPPVSFQARVVFGGDMMFDRSIRTTMTEKGGGYLFSCITPLLKGSDLVVANLEGPITATSSRSVGSEVGAPDNFIFTFPLETASLLAEHNIRIVNIGNNHILNFGRSGVEQTTEWLTRAGVGYFGDPLTQSSAAGSFNGVRIAFINYNEFERASTASTTIAQIQEARVAGSIPVVYTHWGIEYATTSTPYVRALAHRFVDAGAEVVIGSHPHVVQESEIYEGKYIYYSLGNFIFDQYWMPSVRSGLLLEVTFTRAGLQSVKEIPIELLRDRRTCTSS